MSALVPTRRLADSLADLFEPIDAEPLAALLAEYRDRRETLARVASVFADEQTRDVLPYFIDGNASDRHAYVHAESLFSLPGAVALLNATYWQRALEATDVLDVMPAERRKQWREQIERRDVPEFTDAAIRATIAEHLAARHRYFAERVDGIFSALSPEHVTNSPAGFGGKLIIGYMVDSDGDPVCSRVPLLTDLRVVVARFMGRTDIGEGGHVVHTLTRQLVRYARRERCGEWVTVDGGAIEIKLHQVGTCHIRLHSELVWRLNAVLASVHPGAIPESARTRPKRGSVKKARAVELVTRPLPFAVVKTLSEYSREARDLGPYEWQFGFGWNEIDKHVRAEVFAVLASIGGVPADRPKWATGRVRFDYDATDVLREIVASGCVPDQRAHQFYPTPRSLAERVVALAEIGPDDVVLEPSAGTGAIAELLPKGAASTGRERTLCIEASALHVAVLRAKGLAAKQADFITWAQLAHELGVHFDRVVMNPPFDRGQWVEHVKHAARMLSPRRGARLVAILPASAPKRLELPGFTLTWSEPIDGAFAGTNISVVILVAERES